jgi:predicted kinase
MTIYVCVGMIASGKSTWAQPKADAGAFLVCHDKIIEDIHGRYRYDRELRDAYHHIEESIAWSALCVGRDVIVDRTHLTRESRRRWVEWAADFVSINTFDGEGPSVQVVAVRFSIETPDVHARRRCTSDPRGRPWEDWFGVAEHHYAQAMAEPLSADEGFDEIVEATQ